MPIRWRIALIWACLLARLSFYAAVLPLWEGYDEWAHFSVIRIMALRGEALPGRDQAVPRDVARSLELAPVPWELRSLPPPSVTEDVYWGLTAAARAEREASFRSMPAEWSGENSTGTLTAYEALQPPLYYWTMMPAVRLLSGSALSTQVYLVRWLSAGIASLIVPLIFGIAQMALGDDRLSLCCAAAVAVMPGFAFDVARAGNDCLSVVWFTLLTWIGLKLTTGASKSGRWWAGLGVALGAGLLTKAYFLAAPPAVLLLPIWCRTHGRDWRPYTRALMSVAIAAAISGWWYWRNLITTGTLSGLSEATLLRDTGASTLLQRAVAVPWGTAIDAILLSHLYFGGWSGLTVRSWMYHVFYAVILAAACGLVRLTRQPPIQWLVAVYAVFWAAQMYNVVLLFASKGLPGSMGWYLYAVVAAQAVLTTGGLSRIRAWAPAGGVVLFDLLDLYTLHAIDIPYYAGMIRHKPSGAIAALHFADVRMVGFGQMLERLTAFKPAWISEPLVVALWIAYVSATFWLAASPFAGRDFRVHSHSST